MKRFFALVFCLAAILLAGCQKEPSLTISGPASLELGVDGGSQTLTFTANRDWTVSSSDSWVSVSPSSGKASDKPVSVTVRCNANTTYDDRSATVTIRMEGLTQSVTVRQPANLGLILPSKSYDIPADARSVEVEVQANVQYTVSVSADWIKQTGSKGLTSTKLTFSVEENTTYDARSATITIKPQAAGMPEQVVSVKQAQKDALIVGNTSYDMPYGGGEIEVKVDANVSFEVKSGADWIQHLDTKALSSSTVRLKVEENPTFASREGKVEISQKGGGLSYTLTVKQAGRVAVTGVTLNSTTLSLVVGESWPLVATVKPDNATDKIVAWSSDKPEVAEVDGVGRVTAIAGGTAKITATAGGKSATCTVTVEPRTIKVGDTMEVPADGGTFEIDIEYNTDFTVEVEQAAQSWITFIQTKAMTSGKLQFSFAENEAEQARSGKVTVKDRSGMAAPVTLTFTQAGAKKVLTVGEVPLIPYEGGTVEVPIEFNTDYSVEVMANAADWLTYLSTKALTNGTLTFWTGVNDGGERRGNVVIKDLSGKVGDIVLEFVQEGNPVVLKARGIMEKVYQAWGAQSWKEAWVPGENWPGLDFDMDRGKVSLYFNGQGLKGAIPDCIGELGDLIYSFQIFNEPDLTGALPDSFRKLVALERLTIANTSMTSMPDVFADMKSLKIVEVYMNEKLACSIPDSIGDSPVLQFLTLQGNSFTGGLKGSWARLGADHFSFYNNCLSGQIPQEFLALDNRWKVLDNILWQKEGYGFDISEIDIPGGTCWPVDEFQNPRSIADLDGNLFSFEDVIQKNKYTVFISWAPWCPFSKELMPQLRDYYKTYRQDGLEVIATVMLTDTGALWKDNAAQKKEIQEKGYGLWYNFSSWDTYQGSIYLLSTPTAEVYDSNGNILFSSFATYPDPVRKRFSKTASTDLIPFLESVLGPAGTPDVHTSTDFSQDGKVLTLQTASVSKPIDIVFLGDGYTDKDMGDGGLYETLMKQSMEEFFAIEPYKTFRNRFNVYAVKAVSKNNRVGDGYETALATYFGNGSEVSGDVDKCYEYAMKVPGITSKEDLLVSVLVNTQRHAGMTVMNAGQRSSVAFFSTNGNDASLFGSTLRHEAGGHGFGFLADEYVTFSATAPADHIAYYNDVYEKYGWFSNVDFTNDPAKVRWSAFLSDARYKDEVGIFEGGALYSKGAWRPSQNSMMNMNLEYFNAPSRWAIYQRIMKLTGEECTFAKFLEYDAVNRGKSQAAVRPPLKLSERREPGAPPVIVR